MRMLSPLSTTWALRSLNPGLREDVFEDFDRIVDSFLRTNTTSVANLQPSCDIDETKTHFLVTFDMPGVKAEDLKIEIQGNRLTVSGERLRETKADKEDAAFRQERFYGKYERTFELPVTIDKDKIEAHYENGVLRVALPKAEAAKGRTIEIQTGQGSFLSKLLGSKKEGAPEMKDVKIS